MKINGATAKITSALLKEFRPHQPVSSLASGSGRGVRELFARVFNDRPAYSLQIAALYRAGLEDPLEILPAAEQMVAKLFKGFAFASQLEKLSRLFSAVVPTSCNKRVRRRLVGLYPI